MIAGLPADRPGTVVDLGPLRGGEERRRRLLDQLLVAALQRAVPGAHHDHVAVLVGQHLRLHVAGLVEVPLDEALAPPERGDRLPGGRLEQLRNFLHRAGHLQPAPTAAESRLDRHRQAVVDGEGHHLVGAADRVGGAGDQWGAGPLGDVPGGHLVAQVADRLRGRTDPGQAGVDDRLGEVGVLGEEAVPGMHRVGAGTSGDVDQLVDAQVGIRGGVTTQGVRFVGERGVQASRSESAYTATLPRPASRQARMTRTAISPRLAMSTLRTWWLLPAGY